MAGCVDRRHPPQPPARGERQVRRPQLLSATQQIPGVSLVAPLGLLVPVLVVIAVSPRILLPCPSTASSILWVSRPPRTPVATPFRPRTEPWPPPQSNRWAARPAPYQLHRHRYHCQHQRQWTGFPLSVAGRHCRGRSRGKHEQRHVKSHYRRLRRSRRRRRRRRRFHLRLRRPCRWSNARVDLFGVVARWAVDPEVLDWSKSLLRVLTTKRKVTD